eukprot:gene7260-8647_t
MKHVGRMFGASKQKVKNAFGGTGGGSEAKPSEDSDLHQGLEEAKSMRPCYKGVGEAAEQAARHAEKLGLSLMDLGVALESCCTVRCGGLSQSVKDSSNQAWPLDAVGMEVARAHKKYGEAMKTYAAHLRLAVKTPGESFVHDFVDPVVESYKRFEV